MCSKCGLCECCHKRPKCHPHRYCSKTCAINAGKGKGHGHGHGHGRGHGHGHGHGHKSGHGAGVVVCVYCGVKPRWGNHPYCGKTCATLAKTKPKGRKYCPPIPIIRTARFDSSPQYNAPQYNSGESHSYRERDTSPAGSLEGEEDLDYGPTDEEADYGPTDEDLDDGPLHGDNGSDGDELDTDLDAYPSDEEEEKEEKEEKNSYHSSTLTHSQRVGLSKIGAFILTDDEDEGLQVSGSVKSSSKKANKPCIMCKKKPQTADSYFCSTSCQSKSTTKVSG